MNAFLGAGLFDGPWVVVVIVLISTIANWLSKRREAREATNQPEDNPPAPAAGSPPKEIDLQELLRRFMVGEPPVAAPAPPPLPRTVTYEAPPPPILKKEKPREFPKPSALPPELNERRTQATRRSQELSDRSHHPATAVSLRHNSRAGRRFASKWRNPRGAREAFVASLVFAPPKSLEPRPGTGWV